MKKRISILLVILTVLMTCLSGCSRSTSSSGEAGTDQKDSKAMKSAKGRYMEKEIELPKLGVNESIVKIIQNTEQQFEVYTENYEASKVEYLCYQLNEDMIWEKTKPGWLNDSKLIMGNILSDISLGEDGNYYAIIQSMGAGSYIVKSLDMDNAQLVEIPYLNDPQSKKGMDIYPSVQKFAVLKNGNLVIRVFENDKSLFVFSPKGEKVDEVVTGSLQNFQVKGSTIIVMNEEEKIICYNTETKSIDRTIEYDGQNKGVAYAQKNDGTLILGDSEGIHRLEKDGTLWETTVDGALNSMNMPSLEIMDVYVVEGEQEQEEYYISYMKTEDVKTQKSLKQYVYDENVTAVPGKEITVY
ncbi:MAG TPA: hypothetical protein VHP81_10230, partial [Lachnospiraceae bacterium]|nr:hypothetical protein [Lachnospiraceae bacterium]